MPQFDFFLFPVTLIYFTLSFFIVLYYNYNFTLPKIAAILKLRYKINHSKKKLDVTKAPIAISTSFIEFAIFIKKNN